jgi:hypothetical protein
MLLRFVSGYNPRIGRERRACIRVRHAHRPRAPFSVGARRTRAAVRNPWLIGRDGGRELYDALALIVSSFGAPLDGM